MKTQNSTRNTKGVSNENKNNVNNAANSPKRVVETRDAWEVIFNHSVLLIVNYAKGIKVEKPREGFDKAFGSAASSPNSRGYAKSLIWGFATNKAGKVLKNLDDVATREAREKIAIAILTDCKLVKGDSEAIKASLNKVEPKRERVLAEAVLAELTKPEPKSTTKGGKNTKKSETKATAPKGSNAKGETKKSTTKGGSKSKSSKPATKGGKKSSK